MELAHLHRLAGINKLESTLKKIEEFWNWFVENEAVLKPNTINNLSVRSLEDKLRGIRIHAWEIGPSINLQEEVDQFFAIPLSFEKVLDDHTKLVIGGAPSLRGWEFLAGLPSKKWDRVITWGQSSELINANDWIFQISRYPDGLHDVTLIVDNLYFQTISNLEDLAYTVVEFELGQQLMDELVYEVKVKVISEARLIAHSVSISTLKETLLESVKKRAVN